MPGNISPVQVRIIADDETAAAVAAATARLQTFQAAGANAGAAMSKSFHEARGSAALLGEEVGVRLNRHLQGLLATSTLLGPLLQTAFPVIAAIGFAEVIFDAGKKLYDFATNAKSAADAVTKLVDHFKDMEKANAKSNERITELRKEFETIGVSGSASGVIKLQQLGQELERVQAAMRRNEDQSFGLAREWDRLTDSSGKLITSQAQADAESRRLAVDHGRLSTRVAELVAQQYNLEKQAIADKLREDAQAAEKAAAAFQKLQASIQKEIAEWTKLFDIQKQGKEAKAAYSIQASEAIAYVTKGLEKVIPLEELRNHGLDEANKLMLLQIGHQLELGKATEAWRDELAHLDDAIFGASHPNFEVMKTLNQSLTQSFDSMFSDIALGTRGISQAFESMASSIAASVLQAVAKMLILGPLLRGLSSLLGAFAPVSQIPLFGGRGLPLGPGDFAVGPPHAGGGPVMPNVAYMVGERGPEMFMPSSAGSIVSNSGLGGARIVNQVTVVNQTGRPVSAQIGKSSFNGKEYVTTVILQDFAENGPIRRAFGG